MSEGQGEARKSVSLSFELESIHRMAGGARLLLVAARDGWLPLQGDEHLALESAEAILDHLIGRLLDLQRVIRGAVDPAAIWTEANSALPKVRDGDPDVRLEAWSPAKRLEVAQRHATQEPVDSPPTRRRRSR